MSTKDLVNLASQLSCTLNESLQRKIAKILNIQLQQMKSPETKTLLVSAIIAKARTLEKRLLQI